MIVGRLFFVHGHGTGHFPLLLPFDAFAGHGEFSSVYSDVFAIMMTTMSVCASVYLCVHSEWEWEGSEVCAEEVRSKRKT